MIVITLVVVGAAAAVVSYRLDHGDSPTDTAASTDAASTYPVTRRTLAERTTVDGTLGYAGSYTVVNQLGPAGGSAGGSSAAGSANGQPASADSESGSAVVADAPAAPMPSPTSSAPPTPTSTPTATPTPTPTRGSSAPSPTRRTAAPPPTRRTPGPETGTHRPAGSGQGSTSDAGPASSRSAGIVTALPALGQVIRQGQVLYRVDGTPVVLLYGSVPAYRTLREGSTGADVTELNRDLVALGYATTARLSPSSDDFGSATKSAVEKLQDRLGVDRTGAIDLGQAVFLPSAVRVTTVRATLGAPLSGGATVLQATSTTRQIAVDLDASEQSSVRAGDDVTITLPDKRTTSGRVAAVGTVASSAGSGSGSSGSDSSGSSGSGSSSQPATVEVDVTPLDPRATGAWDQAPVEVDITTGQASNALVVPIDALQAQPGGGYAVEVVGSAGERSQVSVSLGLFDDTDGLVQVTGTRLRAGQRVVVPAS
jgi:hypothetical protein